MIIDFIMSNMNCQIIKILCFLNIIGINSKYNKTKIYSSTNKDLVIDEKNEQLVDINL
jgi:hypothetical protein